MNHGVRTAGKFLHSRADIRAVGGIAIHLHCWGVLKVLLRATVMDLVSSAMWVNTQSCEPLKSNILQDSHIQSIESNAKREQLRSASMSACSVWFVEPKPHIDHSQELAFTPSSSSKANCAAPNGAIPTEGWTELGTHQQIKRAAARFE